MNFSECERARHMEGIDGQTGVKVMHTMMKRKWLDWELNESARLWLQLRCDVHLQCAVLTFN